MNVKSIVVEHLYWDGSIKTLQLSPNIRHEMWVAFPDEYEEPRNAPFHFQNPDDEEDYEANYAKCKARKLSKDRYSEEKGVYTFKNSWQGIPTERQSFSFYTLYLPENAIPVQIEITDPYNKGKQFTRTIYKDETKQCYVIYLQCSSKHGVFSFDMRCVFKKDIDGFKRSSYIDDFHKDFHQSPELWRNFLEKDECEKTENFFAQSMIFNHIGNETNINVTGNNNQVAGQNISSEVKENKDLVSNSMSYHDKVRKIWADPVVSKIISGTIVSILGLLGAFISKLNLSEEIKSFKFWIISLACLIILFFIVKFILNYIILGKSNKKEIKVFAEEKNTNKEIKKEVIPTTLADKTKQEEIAVSQENKSKKYDWLDSDILFAQCIAQTFPGNRDVVWYDSAVAVRRLNLFFENLRKQEPTGDAVWWRRGYQAFSVKNAEILDVDKIFLGNDRFKISRMAVFVSPSYYKHFIYIEADAEATTGLYSEITDSYIEENKKSKGYIDEEYGEFNGKLISRQEYDDGASVHENNVIQHNGQAKLRVRYLTKVNFILTPKNSPYNNKKFEMNSVELFNEALYNEESIHELFEFMDTFQKIDMPGNRYK